MHKLAISAALLAALVVAPVALAATYQYVSSQGDVKMITANTPASAMMLATDIARTSGVILVTDVDEPPIPPSTDVPL